MRGLTYRARKGGPPLSALACNRPTGESRFPLKSDLSVRAMSCLRSSIATLRSLRLGGSMSPVGRRGPLCEFSMIIN